MPTTGHWPGIGSPDEEGNQRSSDHADHGPMKEAIRDRLTDGDAKDGVRAGRGFVRGGCARGTNAPCLVNELEQTRRIVHAHLPKCNQGHSSEIAPAEVSSRALKRRSHLPEPDHVDGAVAVLTHLAARAAAEQIEHQAAIDLKEAHAHLTQSDAIRCNQRRNQTQSSRDRPQRSSRPPDAIRCNQMQSETQSNAIKPR